MSAGDILSRVASELIECFRLLMLLLKLGAFDAEEVRRFSMVEVRDAAAARVVGKRYEWERIWYLRFKTSRTRSYRSLRRGDGVFVQSLRLRCVSE